jgi:cation/acetate symporter
MYYKMINPQAPTSQQVMLSKMLLLLVALAAAYVAVQKPANILFLVSAAFSFAAAALFPVLVLGIFWQRANKWGAIAGMVGGLGITIYYMAMTQPWLRGLFGVSTPIELWWGIQPISAGIFGVPVGFLLVILVSLLTPPPNEHTRELVEHIRYPRLFKD